ncbi:exosome complex component RRP40 [Sitophilus oryzae]|uniref:Ribosomal RNA-processing protein 40 n=1 Tax=Sitophilus oryzae TaxID=7048 RepID=A0A6J2XUG5_SITOR|nr:exosome complex component RRP40 [Sitophilus oryzae]
MSELSPADFYLPGEIIRNLKSKDREVIIGPGLCRNESDTKSLIASQAGYLCFRAPNTYWLEGRRNRYIPKKADLVLGIVTKKSSDNLKVDIGSAESASLSMLAFEGATKKVKPDVNVGDVIYAKVINAHKEMEPELVCIDQYYKAGKLGVLSNEGFVINLKQKLIQQMLNPENPLLRTLGRKFPYEIVIGVNGKVWMRANQCKDVLTLCRAFQIAEYQKETDIIGICRQFK